VDNTKELTHISLCTGYGGIDIGLKRAIGNIRTIAYSEIEAYAVCNLVSKIEKGYLDAAPIWPNLKTFPYKQFYGKVDILSGGFPCQPFSTAGKRKGSEDPRHLFPYILKGIRELGNPPFVFLENVQGIISSKLKGEWRDEEGTPVLLHVLRELERLGYEAEAGIFSARETGAPHQRKRVFILAKSKLVNSKHFRQFTNSINSRIKESSKKKCRSIKTNKPERTSRYSNSKELENITRFYQAEFKTAYPSFRGEKQYNFEPPRVIKKEENMVYSNSRFIQNFNHDKKICKKKILRQEARMHIYASINPILGNSYNSRLQRTLSKTFSRKKEKKSIARSSSFRNIQRKLEFKMGGIIDGFTYWLDYDQLSRSYDNRTDELRLLGNGVVPDTAKTAFIILFKRFLGNSYS